MGAVNQSKHQFEYLLKIYCDSSEEGLPEFVVSTAQSLDLCVLFSN